MIRRFFRGNTNRLTEARASIRESVRIFGCIEQYVEREWLLQSQSCHAGKAAPPHNLPKRPLHLFERLVTTSADSNRLVFDGVASCGFTSQCFASLFFSKKQIAANHILLYTNAADLTQLWDNLNIILYGIRRRHYGHGGVQFPMSGFIDGVTRLFRFRATAKIDELTASLLRDDPPEQLPRVLFCNLTWILLHDEQNEERLIEDNGTDEDGAKFVKDHQWIVIKHANDHFQLVQGYIATSSSRGHCLAAFQNLKKEEGPNSNDNNNEAFFRFSSRHGFNFATMEGFLCELRQFAGCPKFNGLVYQGLFGVFLKESANIATWPSASFRELDDASIDGYGDRYIANSVAQALPVLNSEQNHHPDNNTQPKK
jgi:hypothetical protein